MERTDVVVVGAGQAGLAASRCLAARGIDHLVLDRGRVAERWRSERPRSLRLLTPRSLVRLPGAEGGCADPDSFLSRLELVAELERYAAATGAAIRERVAVRRVGRFAGGYSVETDGGTIRSRAVVIATGHCDLPRVPRFAGALDPDVASIPASWYRDPDSVPHGGVLVVGASASGVQIADELRRAGREVFLSVGHHARLPRSYRGRDVYGWLDALGVLRERLDPARSADRARRAPSPQLSGAHPPRDVDLPALAARGVHLLGRAVDADDGHVRFADDLGETTRRAEASRRALLARIDAYVEACGLGAAVPPPAVPPAFVAGGAPRALHLRSAGVGAVVWATGYRRSYPWLALPIVGADGEIHQRGGVTPAPGVFTLGLAFQRRRDSSFLSGVGDDARAVADRLDLYLRRRLAAA